MKTCRQIVEQLVGCFGEDATNDTPISGGDACEYLMPLVLEGIEALKAENQASIDTANKIIPLEDACRRLVITIEATGGVTQNADTTFSPAGEPDWIDLGDAYIAAKAALGHPVGVPKPARVKVFIEGGNYQDHEAPDGIEVEIIDSDNLEGEGHKRDCEAHQGKACNCGVGNTDAVSESAKATTP
jgi:hypothetical protein